VQPGRIGVYGRVFEGVRRGVTFHVPPTPAPKLTIVELIVEKALESLQVLNFAYCAQDPSASAANSELTENSTPNTALSLDGKGSTGQSVVQHVCTG
jgi:hypothetical protein